MSILRRRLMISQDVKISGCLNTDYLSVYPKFAILYKDQLVVNPNYNTYVLSIPRNANILILNADNTMAGNPAWISYSNEDSTDATIVSTNQSIANKYDATIVLDHNYQYVYIPIQNISRNVNINYAFSK